MRISDWSSDVCSSDVDDAQPAGEPGGEDQRLVQLLAELMGAEAARRAGPWRVQLADVEGRERGDVLKIGDVEDPEEGVQAARPVIVLLIPPDGDAPAGDGAGDRQDGVARLRG